MKTLKSIVLGLALLVISGVANAAPKSQTADAPLLTKTGALEVYTNAVIHGKISGLEDLFSNTVEFNVYNGEKMFKLDKDAAIEALKANENIEQDCKLTTTTVEEKSKSTVVKLEMKYNNYVRTSLVTFVLKGNNWKITKIENRS